MADYLQVLEQPELRSPRWVGAFVGWADAQEAASTAVRYLIRQLSARKFAELDPEEFYDFTAVRPVAFNDPEGHRRLRWPSNELYYWKHPEDGEDLILFLGTEPSLRWKTYIRALLRAVDPYDLRLVVNLGSLLDGLPHTRDPLLSGGGNTDAVRARLGSMRIMGTSYQGPVGITSVLMDACTHAGIDFMSVWAHAPHYLQRGPNFALVHALVARASSLLELDVPTEELRTQAEAFTAEATRAVAGSVEVSSYVKRLERQYDAAKVRYGQGLPPPEEVAQEVEDFFRRQGGQGQEPFSSN